ncbi:MAG: hypothetical protein JKX91_13000 [Rhizobiaceae bacterium]|nr:hypothetical protein [Rhizobiaceae bacterium]
MENVTAQIFRSASAGFTIGGMSFAANAASSIRKDLADSASTIPSVSVMGGGASRSSRAMGRIFDIVSNMGKSKHHHHHHYGKHSQVNEAHAAKESDSVASVSFRSGRNGFDAIKGSSNDDTINYSNSSARAVSTYIDGGGGDDVINVASTAYGEQRVYGGAGDDTISLSGRNARAYGGDGDDVIAVAGLYVGAKGGAGDDVISVSGEIVSSVSGGEGDDTITVNGKIVGTVRGGAGDDVITVSSDNVSSRRWGAHGNFGFGGSFDPTIIGGEGNDTISVDGKARIVHRAGDGQDVINITDTTDFATFGEGWFDDVMRVDEANFSYENGELTVTFDGRDEKLTIRSEVGELSWEITSDRTFVVTINKSAEASVSAEAYSSVEVDVETVQDDQADS